MPSLFDRAIARIAELHAAGVYRRFLRCLDRIDDMQRLALRRTIAGMKGSELSRRFSLDGVRDLSDLRRAAPLLRYADLSPYIERVREGDFAAMFAARQRPLMFATSSGTTSARKYIPVTPEFVRQYRRGWNTFGLKMLRDHPRAILRPILQSSGRWDESRSSAGIPCGAITGLLARTQKGIVRRFYVGAPEIAEIDDAAERYYALARFAIVHDVAFAVTANPATLIRIAQVADERSETLIRDVHDGTLSVDSPAGGILRGKYSRKLAADRQRAAALAAARCRDGRLKPCSYWRMEFAACWTGGSMGHYLPRLRDWYGPIPIRDVGLLASEGRVSIPLDDDVPVGVLDVEAACFEFIPAEAADAASPTVLAPGELERGRDYVVVLTNDAGLIRYRLDDVVRVHGHLSRTPLVEFLHRAGRVSSMAGEKLTEHQVVQAVNLARERQRLPAFDFLLAAIWADPPFYRLYAALPHAAGVAESIDEELARQNDEYASRRKSVRLDPVEVTFVSSAFFASLDRRLLEARGSTAEQFKRPTLLLDRDRELLAHVDEISSDR
ncbi:MAG: GH3 auxin-responsive promoter family protein [Planctomycetes bacterium]|nr:GH3 auxin-responsive promoter family protein [Planctomycetota bacterium]